MSRSQKSEDRSPKKKESKNKDSDSQNSKFQLQDSELENLRQQVGELTEALQRERADSENIRRRHDEQIASLKTAVKANVVRELLPAIDNLERALKHVPKDLDGNDYVKGVQAVVKQFDKVLADMGVERIKTVGEVFDPRYHEAVHMDDGVGTVEVVSEELQAGYRLGDEIIRHAMVRVKMEEADNGNSESENKERG